MSMAANTSLVFQSQGGSHAPNFMKSVPSLAAMLLKNSEPTDFFFFLGCSVCF